MSKILVMSKRMMIFSAFLIIVIAEFAIVQTAAAAGPAPVNLGTAGNFVILSKSGITDVPTSPITGDVGTSPITGAADHLTCAEVIGNVYSVDAAGPAPCSVMDSARLTTAVLDMQTAYTDAAGRPTPDFLDLGSGNIGGLTLVPGIYKWSTGVTIQTDVTLSGGPNDVWIFQIAQDLSMASTKTVILSGGAQARNIFWQVAGKATLGTTSHFEGIILSKTAINLQTGASINGRLLAQTAVTLQSNVVTKPGNAATTSTSYGGGGGVTPTVTATVKATPKVNEPAKPTVTVATTVVAPAETAKPKPTATPKAPGFEAIIAISVIAMLAASILKDRKRR
jgi:hypothetical protein